MLRCPNCEWAERRVLHEDLVDELEAKLDRDRDELVVEFLRLARANTAEELERFAEALRSDAILPMDF